MNTIDGPQENHFAYFFRFYILNLRIKLQRFDFRYDHNGSDKITTKDWKVWCYEMSNKICVVPM